MKPTYKLTKLERPLKRAWEAKALRWSLVVTRRVGIAIQDTVSYWPTKKAALAALKEGKLC